MAMKPKKIMTTLSPMDQPNDFFTIVPADAALMTPSFFLDDRNPCAGSPAGASYACLGSKYNERVIRSWRLGQFEHGILREKIEGAKYELVPHDGHDGPIFGAR